MYTVYSIIGDKKVCMHDDLVADESVKLLDPHLKLVDSGAGSLQFKLAPNNIAYGAYNVSETKVLGIVNDGDPTDQSGSLVSGGLNQNGEEVADSTALRTGLISRDTSDAILISGIEANIEYSEYQLKTGIPKESISSKPDLTQGYFSLTDGTITANSKIVRFREMISVTGTSKIKVVAYRKNGTPLRYGMCLYNSYKQYMSYVVDTYRVSGSEYTIPEGVAYVWIWIRYETGADSIKVADIRDDVYVYKDGVTYAHVPASQNSRNWTSDDCLFLDDYLSVSGDFTRIYYNLDLKPAVDTDGQDFESGTVTISNEKAHKVQSSTNVRIGLDLLHNDWFSPPPNLSSYRITATTISGKKLVPTVIGASSLDDNATAVSVTLDGDTFAYSYPLAYYWIVLRYEDNSNIDANDIDSFRLDFVQSKNRYIGGTVCLYSAEGDPATYTYLRTGGSTGNQDFTGYIDVSLSGSDLETATNLSLYFQNMPLGSGPDAVSLLPSMINSFKMGLASTITYEVFQYDSNGNFIGASDITSTGSVSLLSLCASFRIVLRYETLDNISVTDIDALFVQRQVVDTSTTTKSLDLVGRMTSTIRVYRSSWGITDRSNGEFNVLAAQTITDEFEQGWYRIGSGINGNPISSDLAVRTKDIIPVQLSTSDYISIDASIRGSGKKSDTTPADSETSSSYRRPCGYVLYFYNGDTCLGVIGSQSSPIESNSDINVPYDNVDGIKICIRPIAEEGSDYLYISDLDFVKIYSTNASIKPCDISSIDGSEAYNDNGLVYTLSTKPLTLTNVVNTSTNTWTARINAQSRQGLSFTWGVAMYDQSMNFLGLQRWIDQDTRFEGLLSGTKYIRIMLRYNGSSSSPYGLEIGPNDVSVLNVSCLQISKSRTEELLWEGRVLSEDVDFRNCRVIYCEGDLAYLNDTQQAPKIYDNISFRNYISKLIDEHNSRVSTERRFVLGQTWEPTKKKDDTYGQSDSEENINRHVTNFETTLELLNNLVDDFGGHLRVRRSVVNNKVVRYIDWLEKYPRKSNQVIRFGENLLDFTRKYDMSNLCTAIYPTGEVLVQAQSSGVGEHVSKDSSVWSVYRNTLLYQADDGRVYMQQGSNLSGYQTVIATVETSTVNETKSYYFSCRLHGGFVACFITDSSNNIYSGCIERAGSDRELGFVDYIDKEIKIPPGANKVWICNFGDAIPIALKKQTKEVSGLDQLLTVEGVNTDRDASGRVWHIKGSPYITNSEAIEKYGWIERRLDLPGVKTETDLYNAAKTYLKDSQFDEMTLEVSAIDLNSLGVDAEFIDILDEIRVISEPHGLDKFFPATEIDIPLNNPSGQTFKLGTQENVQLTSQQVSTNSELLQKIEKAPSTESVIRTAFANAAEAINNATQGSYINYLYDDDGHMCELVISDAPPTVPNDITTIPANSSVWRWNQAGLAHSSNGYNLTEFDTNIAITAEGQVIANSILGSLLYGYIVASGKIIVGNNLPSSKSSLENLGPSGVNNYVSIRDVNNNQNASIPYIDLYDGKAHFGTVSGSTRSEYGQISGQLSIYQDGGGTHNGLLISSSGNNGLIVIDTADLGVGTGGGLSTVSKTMTGTVNIDNTTLYFKNGMLYYVERSS